MSDRRDLRRSLLLFALALIGTTLIGLVAGWLFGRTSPERAGAALVEDLVVREPAGSDPGDPAAPTSGESGRDPACGVSSDPLAIDTQVASLEAGVVVVQYRPEAVGEVATRDLADFADADAPVLVAPNPALASDVAATAWTRRLPLDGVNHQLLRAFIAAYAQPDTCPA